MDDGKPPPGTVCVMCHAPQGRMTAGPKGAICEQCVIDAANALYPQAQTQRFVNSYDAGSGFYRRRGPNV